MLRSARSTSSVSSFERNSVHQSPRRSRPRTKRCTRPSAASDQEAETASELRRGPPEDEDRASRRSCQRRVPRAPTRARSARTDHCRGATAATLAAQLIPNQAGQMRLAAERGVARMARFGVRSGAVAFARLSQHPATSGFERTGANGREHRRLLPCRRSWVRVPSSAPKTPVNLGFLFIIKTT